MEYHDKQHNLECFYLCTTGDLLFSKNRKIDSRALAHSHDNTTNLNESLKSVIKENA